jgi:hypothetical protein
VPAVYAALVFPLFRIGSDRAEQNEVTDAFVKDRGGVVYSDISFLQTIELHGLAWGWCCVVFTLNEMK